MKKFILFLVTLNIACALNAQFIDSLPFLYLKVIQIQTLEDNMLEIRTNFKSDTGNNPDFFIQGKGRILIDPELLPQGTNFNLGVVLEGRFILTNNENFQADNSSNGNTIPLPVVLNGFLIDIGGNSLSPPLSIVLQAIQFEMIDLGG